MIMSRRTRGVYALAILGAAGALAVTPFDGFGQGAPATPRISATRLIDNEPLG